MLAVAVVGLAASACQGNSRSGQVTFESRQGLQARLYLPDPRTQTAPLVVMVPGGGWTSADPSGFRPLAERLASHGLAVALTTYRVGGDSARFPVPVSDILCAVDAAAEKASQAGVAPSRVVVLGHSAGAQLAAVAALTGDRYRTDCTWPARRIDAFVGLAGPYDLRDLADLAEPLFGVSPASAPQAWHDANPLTWAGERPSLPALLAAGTADDLVSPSFTHTFADALRKAGHPVKVLDVADATHASIYRPQVVADAVLEWVRGLN